MKNLGGHVEAVDC